MDGIYDLGTRGNSIRKDAKKLFLGGDAEEPAQFDANVKKMARKQPVPLNFTSLMNFLTNFPNIKRESTRSTTAIPDPILADPDEMRHWLKRAGFQVAESSPLYDDNGVWVTGNFGREGHKPIGTYADFKPKYNNETASTLPARHAIGMYYGLKEGKDIFDGHEPPSRYFPSEFLQFAFDVKRVADQYFYGNGTMTGQVGRLGLVYDVYNEYSLGAQTNSETAWQEFDRLVRANLPAKKDGFSLNESPETLVHETDYYRVNMNSQAGLYWKDPEDEEVMRRSEVWRGEVIASVAFFQSCGNADVDHLLSKRFPNANMMMMKAKTEVTAREKFSKNSRNFYVNNPFVFNFFQIFANETVSNTKPGMTGDALYLTKFNPFQGHLQKFFDRVQERLNMMDGPEPWIPFIFSDNLYICGKTRSVKDSTDMYLFISCDGSKMESCVKADTLQRGIMNMFLNKIESEYEHLKGKVHVTELLKYTLSLKKHDPDLNLLDSLFMTGEQGKRKPTIAFTWLYYLRDVVTRLSINNRAVLHDVIFTIPGLGSGVAPTFLGNTFEMTNLIANVKDFKLFKRDKQERGLFTEGAEISFSSDFKEVFKRVGVKLKLENVTYRFPLTDFTKTDLLGFDAKTIEYKGKKYLVPCLQRERLLKALVFDKQEHRNRVEGGGESLKGNFNAYVKARSLFFSGGCLDAPMGTYLIRKMNNARKFLRSGEFSDEQLMEIAEQLFPEYEEMDQEALQVLRKIAEPNYEEALDFLTGRLIQPKEEKQKEGNDHVQLISSTEVALPREHRAVPSQKPSTIFKPSPEEGVKGPKSRRTITDDVDEYLTRKISSETYTNLPSERNSMAVKLTFRQNHVPSGHRMLLFDTPYPRPDEQEHHFLETVVKFSGFTRKEVKKWWLKFSEDLHLVAKPLVFQAEDVKNLFSDKKEKRIGQTVRDTKMELKNPPKLKTVPQETVISETSTRREETKKEVKKEIKKEKHDGAQRDQFVKQIVMVFSEFKEQALLSSQNLLFMSSVVITTGHNLRKLANAMPQDDPKAYVVNLINDKKIAPRKVKENKKT